MNRKVSKFLKDYRVILLLVLVAGSIAAVSTLGIQQGLDLKGGSLIQIKLEKPVDAATMNTVTSVLDKRLNIFGVKDVKVRASGDQNVIVEIAGVQPDQVADIVGKPGKFEARIGNETVLTGADIVSVQAPIITANEWEVPFKLSTAGAQRFAEAARGKAGQPVNMYLDDRLITSPEISPEVATGKPTTDVSITGAENSKEEAEAQAKEIETLLKSGSLPVKVKIVGVSSVSAELGKQFVEGALIAGLLAVLAIAVILIIRYRTPILVVPIFMTTLAELIIILGAAAVIRWNIDLAAIAGMLAAIGTGVDDQIIITDEVLAGEGRRTRRKFRIKDAFFIIFASAGTLIAAMLPLAYVGFARGATGIGLLAGFAFTTVLGVLIGVFITRPVYAKFIETFNLGRR
ncbi:preprotein translocase subunit SecD [Methanothermobacter marburgensis]|uniref:Protein-export membrane protein SecD n=1 Tax=Methanothermobacter marburgensis (strain ATCC BAA-927 / DSM 2133 / JCM 14651 / NBRC 100331 / OCM 82 / Marburg) TaxID=79929 RepID=D9PX86_METTM|nr:preprotein translocase subunit SecD [Methanothermobacter marburgensis]ADL58834.1 preprotein translocase subunit [Methanothermobacter marburgensis str. Marburg]WBF09384.1 preprotein translocase subunit SecD [Methanothermobacter marburgensis]